MMQCVRIEEKFDDTFDKNEFSKETNWKTLTKISTCHNFDVNELSWLFIGSCLDVAILLIIILTIPLIKYILYFN